MLLHSLQDLDCICECVTLLRKIFFKDGLYFLSDLSLETHVLMMCYSSWSSDIVVSLRYWVTLLELSEYYTNSSVDCTGTPIYSPLTQVQQVKVKEAQSILS